MITIKIESNPYEQQIKYYRVNDNNKGWKLITKDEYPSSKLLSNDFVKCFFPFKAKDILCQILHDFGKNGELEIIFEGSFDEWKELEEVKNTDSKFNKVILNFGDKSLQDGRDVIQKINAIYTDLEPIVKDCVKDNESINRNLKKYSDASNDIIPICVIGNTNMGKSTFINALIGAEYLPQDKNRCTAKIYKITQSRQSDRANIRFKYDNNPITISFKNSYEISGSLPVPFENKLRQTINEESDSSLHNKISKLLKFLNLFDENNQTEVISDIIEIEVPFKSDVFQKSNNPFVIFDTPGSNYAGKAKDSELLQQQMQDLTNGLPIYVTDYSGLPTTDNNALIEKLQSFTELDQRFTILVVNKADEAKMDNEKWNKDEIERIKGENVPKKLAQRGLQGIYFVSSIMGLGYKNECCFLDKLDTRTFKKNKTEYDNSDPDFVLRLFDFNIIPDQIKNRFEQEIPKDINPVYLNSGLYSIEKEIETYANTYSAYNKCQQSYLFLEKVFKDTTEEIKEQKKRITIETNNLNSNFDKEKQDLIKKLQNTVDDKKTSYSKAREEYIKEKLKKDVIYFDPKELEVIENTIYKKQETERSISDLDSAYKNAKDTRWIEFKQNVSNFRKIAFSAVKGEDTFSNVKDKVIDIYDNYKESTKKVNYERSILQKNKKEAENDSYNEALEHFINMYNDNATTNQDSIYDESKYYWEKKAGESKKELIEIVAMSDALADDQKALLQENILNFEQIRLEQTDINNLPEKDFKSFWSNRIKVSKIGSFFNKIMRKAIEQLHKDTLLNHTKEFENWIDKLLDIIRENIGGMNPTLKLYQDRIHELTKRKQQLEDNRATLERFTYEIHEMISWK